MQDQQQVDRFRLGKDGILIRQIHAAHRTFHQCITNGFGLGAVTNQDGNVVGLERPELFVFAETGVAFFRAVEQVGDFGGATVRLLLAVLTGTDRSVAVFHPQCDARFDLPIHFQLFLAPLGFHRVERKGAAGFGHTEDITKGLVAVSEQLVYSGDHGMGRTEVLFECVVVAFGGRAGFQVREYIRAAECIDGLLGVADHEPADLRLIPIECRENPVLDRIGILKFVDQRYRELLTNHRGQPLAVGPFQGIAQAGEHVIEAQRRGLAAHLVHPPVNPGGHMGQQVRAWQAGVFAPHQDPIKRLAEQEVRTVVLTRLGQLQAVFRKLEEDGVILVAQAFTLGVALQELEHAGHTFRPVAVAVQPLVLLGVTYPVKKVRQGLRQLLASQPVQLGLGIGLRQPFFDTVWQVRRIGFLEPQKGTGLLEQGIRVAQAFALQLVGGTHREAVDDVAPVIPCRLQLVIAGIFL